MSWRRRGRKLIVKVETILGDLGMGCVTRMTILCIMRIKIGF